MARKKKQTPTGYGNIYTPHAGSMIIQVQRESGLANRTIVLSPRQVKLMRWLFSRRGAVAATLMLLSWLFFAVQAARVPFLTGRLDEMRYESTRIDTLQFALDELTKRYAQVQTMLSVPGDAPAASRAPATERAPATNPEPRAEPKAEPKATPATAAAPTPAPVLAAAPAPIVPTVPSRWPLPIAGYLTRGTLGEGPYNGPHPGIDVAVPEGTEIRAAGAGSVVEVGESEEYGKFLRLSHADGYETLYAHASRILVAKGRSVDVGTAIALSGNTGRSTAPHLHFEVRREGATIDPLQLIKQGQ
jgi:murein DD-endopeptidase MepM/ murein hydrolase activator NlpD